jgi:hypothetical protein
MLAKAAVYLLKGHLILMEDLHLQNLENDKRRVDFSNSLTRRKADRERNW